MPDLCFTFCQKNVSALFNCKLVVRNECSGAKYLELFVDYIVVQCISWSFVYSFTQCRFTTHIYKIKSMI